MVLFISCLHSFIYLNSSRRSSFSLQKKPSIASEETFNLSKRNLQSLQKKPSIASEEILNSSRRNPLPLLRKLSIAVEADCFVVRRPVIGRFVGVRCRPADVLVCRFWAGGSCRAAGCCGVDALGVRPCRQLLVLSLVLHCRHYAARAPYSCFCSYASSSSCQSD